MTKLKEHSREIGLHTIIAMMKIIIIIEWDKISALTRQGLRLHNISCVKTIQQINLAAELSTWTKLIKWIIINCTI